MNQKGKRKVRKEDIKIGKIIYEVISEEKEGVKERVEEVIWKVMKKHINDTKERTCCLLENGGEKDYDRKTDSSK